MTDSTDRVLASIDEAIDGYVSEDWAVSGDAMRWQPEKPEQCDVGEPFVDWHLRTIAEQLAQMSENMRYAEAGVFVRRYVAGIAETTSDGRARQEAYAGWSDAWRQAFEGAWCASTWDELPAGRVYVEGYRPDNASASPDSEPRWDDSLHASLNRSIESPLDGEDGWAELGHTTDGRFVYSPPTPQFSFGGLLPDPEAIRTGAAVLGRAMSEGVAPAIAEMGRALRAVGKSFKSLADGNHIQLAPRLYRDDYRAHRRACRLCNPAGNSKRLTVNGAEYRRRTRARRRRNRH